LSFLRVFTLRYQRIKSPSLTWAYVNAKQDVNENWMEVFRAGLLLLQNLNSNYNLLICMRRNHVNPSATLALVLCLPGFYQVCVGYYHVICLTRSTSNMPLLCCFVCIILKILFMTSIIACIIYLTLWSKTSVTVLFLSMFPNILKKISFFGSSHALPARPSERSGVKMKMSMEHWKNNTDRGTPKYLDKNLCQCYFFRHRSHMECPRIESSQTIARRVRRLTTCLE
jgi:hypothetical protein